MCAAIEETGRKGDHTSLSKTERETLHPKCEVSLFLFHFVKRGEGSSGICLFCKLYAQQTIDVCLRDVDA